MAQPSFPILLDVSDRLCVIVGGGNVAIRKAKGLIRAGAQRVRMIAPAFADSVPDAVQRVQEIYHARHLDHAGLVFAATNVPQVNDAVVGDARLLGIWVSRADNDDQTPGDFVSAARLDEGPVTVAVSAGSAALSVMIRDGLADRWEPGWSALAKAMIQLRPEIRERWSEPTRRKIFRELASAQAMALVLSSGVNGLREWINEAHGDEKEAGQ